jgi:hypothetical protein
MDRSAVTNVEEKGDRPASLRPDLPRHRLGIVAISRCDSNIRSRICHRQRDGASDPARAAGDERSLPFRSERSADLRYARIRSWP